MMTDELTAMYNPWNMLQQPRHASSDAHAAFRTLLSAIDQGWQVVEPVQVLPGGLSDTWTYYFVLNHLESALYFQLFIPALPAVEGYIERNQLQVIEGSYY